MKNKNDNSLFEQAAKEIDEHCRALVQSAQDHAVQIGRILLRMEEQMPLNELIQWCLKNTILTESAVKGYMDLANPHSIRSPELDVLGVELLGNMYSLLLSEKERERIEHMEADKGAWMRKRKKVVSEGLTAMWKADSGKFDSKANMETWFNITDPSKDKEQDILFVVIDDYLAHLSNNHRRLQAVHTLITRLRRKGIRYEAEIATE